MSKADDPVEVQVDQPVPPEIGRKWLHLEGAVRVGDVLTSLSILISIIALILTWSHQIELQEREQADKIRSAAAGVLAKLERWQQISLGTFDVAQAEYVKTSELLAADKDVASARDYLWRELSALRGILLQRHLQENMESVYVEIYTYRPELRDLVASTRVQLKAVEEALFDRLLTWTEQDVLSFHDRLSDFQTAELGNALRASTRRIKIDYAQDLAKIMMPLTNVLLGTITASDAELLESVGS